MHVYVPVGTVEATRAGSGYASGMRVPVTLVLGFLGVGKTTAILDLFAQPRPDGSRWAVLVNEFGKVGLDGARLEAGGVAVREVAGGCICCTTNVALRTGLVRLLREVRPDRLIVEPSGLAHPAAILDTLRSPGLREAVVPRATIGLVDPRRLSDRRITDHPTFRDQLELADVLVMNHDDDASDADRARFDALAAALVPPKVVVAKTAFGRLDPAWLDLDPAPARGRIFVHPPHEAVGEGWRFPPDDEFDADALDDAVRAIVSPGPVPAGALRVKGLFRTPHGWREVDATPDKVRWTPTAWRRDSRVDVLAAADPAPDWGAVEAALTAAIRPRDQS